MFINLVRLGGCHGDQVNFSIAGMIRLLDRVMWHWHWHWHWLESRVP
jgi:hypothetical protein